MITAGKITWMYLRQSRRPTVSSRRSALTFIQVGLQVFTFQYVHHNRCFLPRCISIDVSPLSVLTEGPETNAQLMKPGHQSVAARLLAVIDDLEKAHATFQSKEKDEGASVILKP